MPGTVLRTVQSLSDWILSQVYKACPRDHDPLSETLYVTVYDLISSMGLGQHSMIKQVYISYSAAKLYSLKWERFC